MRNMFSVDSPLMGRISDAVDFLVVNVLYLICCLPVFTIGAAKTALYAASFSYMERESTGARIFLRAFRENFPAITLPFLLLLAIGLFLAFDFYVVVTYRFACYVLFAVVLALLLVVYGMIAAQLFLVQARFCCGFRRLLSNALLIALAHPIRTLAVAAMDLFPWALLILEPQAMMTAGLIFLLLYFSVTGFFAVRIMKKPFLVYAAENVDPSASRAE